MRRIGVMLAVLPLLTALSGCVIVADISGDMSWGSWTEREQDIVDTIDRLEFTSRGTLYLVQSDAMRLRIEGNERALARIVISEDGDTLTIQERRDQRSWLQDNGGSSEVIFYLELPYVEEIRHGGQGELKIGPMTLDRLTVTTYGHADTNFSSINVRQLEFETREHGNVNIETLDTDRVRLRSSEHADLYAHDINALDLHIEIRDHSEVWLAGKADMARANVRDHADLDASRLQCEIFAVDAVDHGVARVWAKDTLRMHTEDNAHVEWTGSPKVEESVSISAN